MNIRAYLYWWQNLRAADAQQVLFTAVTPQHLTPFQRRQQADPATPIIRCLRMREPGWREPEQREHTRLQKEYLQTQGRIEFYE